MRGKFSIGSIVSSYGNNIYSLYRQLIKDEYIDVFELIKELNQKLLGDISRNDVSQIYLFFDHDGHAENCIDDSSRKIKEMLEFFCNETDNGKLYISYPMVESIKDFDRGYSSCGQRCIHAILENSSYKNVSHLRSFENDCKKYTIQVWRRVILMSYMRAFCLVADEYRLPSEDEFEKINQESIFINQKIKYISNGSVMILSAFPFFVVEYFGKDFLYRKILSALFIGKPFIQTQKITYSPK